MLSENSIRLSPELFTSAYRAIIRSHLEYCVQTWSTSHTKKNQQTSSGYTTHLWSGCVNLRNPFESHEAVLGEAPTGTWGFNSVCWMYLLRFFKPWPGGNPKASVDILQASAPNQLFSARSVNPGNALPEDVVAATSLAVFKALDPDFFPHQSI